MKTSRIDVHHHLLTPEYLEELASVGVVESGGIPFPSWTPEDSLGFLDRAEIQTTLLSLSSPGLCFGKAARERAVARALNEFAAESGRAGRNALASLPRCPCPMWRRLLLR